MPRRARSATGAEETTIRAEVMRVTWDASFATGVRAIDVQHKLLIEIINDLGDAIAHGKGSAEISRVLGFLKYYSSWHFEREEECMERHRCAAAEVNKKAHCQFVMTFIALEEEFRASGGSPELALRMHRELTSWMVRHIRGVDLELREVAIPAPDPDAMSFA
ncbi:MAG: hemerythrin family protein [Holophagales bacterium]|jgi:hemerythrin-like metal-binding protein|nr:MAG: hemerythrin family protein [Holophagales bacterium]